jgi:hypothetical protein
MAASSTCPPTSPTRSRAEGDKGIVISKLSPRLGSPCNCSPAMTNASGSAWRGARRPGPHRSSAGGDADQRPTQKVSLTRHYPWDRV